jgi:hypothetical protein
LMLNQLIHNHYCTLLLLPSEPPNSGIIKFIKKGRISVCTMLQK